ncbi:MAG TPA: dihydrofolate reductase [Polyangiales bacterium]|nr:dihydrofolate reductase [Polyangiales bacterium]
MQPLVMVVAMAKNRVIGRGQTIPWDLPEDRKHFVAVTRGHALIMGRATFDSIGKPLPKRRNIVVSRQPGLSIEGADVVSSLEQAIALARSEDDAPRVIGGGQIYAEALPLATRIYLTELDAEVDGDRWFPELDLRQWQISERRRGEGATYLTLDRVTAG